MKKILLKGGEVVSAEGSMIADVFFEDGKIVEVGESLNPENCEVIDCEGKIVMPGAIDVHVHFRCPGGEQKEDWSHASAAAASGGVTTVFDMPNNTPEIVDLESFAVKKEIIEGRSHVNYGIYMGYNGKNSDEINNAKNIPGVKIYCAHSTGNMGVEGEFLEKVFKEIDPGIKLLFHSEDEDCIQGNLEKLKAEGRELTPSDHSKIRGPECALKMTKELCQLAKKHERPIHICHVSTEAEAEEISKYSELVTCEVAPHHLTLSVDDYQKWGNYIKMNPPVRDSKDLFGLWKALKFGQIDLIATDHAPHTREEKEKPYPEAPSGVPGVEMMLPILLNAVSAEGLSLEEVCKLVCEKPAELFNIKDKGRIEKGYDADIVVIDMDLEKKFEDKDVKSKCGWSPYSGGLYQGWPIMTYVNGLLVYKEGEVAPRYVGKEVSFS
ncbi:dihydroorotase [Candidatus Peregrinibacteria bacterium]|jgi:dihydroorotase|nr:dihydroorotase [Candidatus Peregrinibacteria bacterium]MBT7736724.1 dihydroorotase [Candidatus Peregrinibacteria bacterium]